MAFAGIPPVPAPHTRVGVGGVLIEAGRALVNRAVYRTRFTIPSGYVDPGESLRAALVREFEEETGLDVEVGELLLARHKVVGPEESDVYFAFQVARRSGIPAARPPEIAEVREVPVGEVPGATWIAQLSRRAIELGARALGAWPRVEYDGGENPGLATELYQSAPDGRRGERDPNSK